MDSSQPVSSTPISLQDRLRLKKYSDEACLAALHGKEIPRALGCSVTRTCVLRGMRYYRGFGTELRDILDYPEFTRAVNAREIMSNIIPDMKQDYEFPYCIWYPEVATEETYRALARKYEGMRYQVGRACAVAGYVELWRELDLLPEVAIAEEARDNEENGRSAVIFEEIMRSPLKYAVMNDYDRTVDVKKGRAGACLNADTAVRSSLKRVHKYERPYDIWASSSVNFGSEKSIQVEEVFNDGPKSVYGSFRIGLEHEAYWNITEDWCISDHNQKDKRKDINLNKISDHTSEPKLRAPPVDERVALFYSPLPVDLPNINKDLLILHAAYSGNIDRYVRLRRPNLVQQEYACIIRGIYHSTMFAKWWSLQPTKAGTSGIEAAITARFIMNNDLSRITEDTCESDLPELIHYPSWAHPTTYAELVRRKPQMTLAVGIACIVTNDEALFRKLKFSPREYDELVKEAMRSHNPYYLEQVIQNSPTCADDKEFYERRNYHMAPIESTSTRLLLDLDGYHVSDEQGGPYNGIGADFSGLDLFVCAPDKMKIPDANGDGPDLREMYRDSWHSEEKVDREAAWYLEEKAYREAAKATRSRAIEKAGSEAVEKIRSEADTAVEQW